MAESDERPAKMRKLESGESAIQSPTTADPVTKPDGRETAPQVPETTATADLPASGGAQNKASSFDYSSINPDGTPLSKNQLKKLRKKHEWEAGREDRKAKKKEKEKEKKARRAEERATQAKEDPESQNAAGHPRRHILQPISLILDCDFDDLMTEKEMISLGSQVVRCYSDNKHAPYQAHIAISSFGGKLKERYETVLTNHHLGWKGVTFLEEDFVKAAEVMDGIMKSDEGGKLGGPLAGLGKDKGFEKVKATPTTEATLSSEESDKANDPASEEATTASEIPASEPSVIYLSSDSPHTLDGLSPNTSYIIGGLVDKNRHKGICYKRALEKGIPTAKLPIGQYMEMQSRTVLTINHVVEIMLKWLEEGDWGNAFLKVIPKRKEAKLRTKRKAGALEGQTDAQEEAQEEAQDDDDDYEEAYEEDKEEEQRSEAVQTS
jgi:tRNA (guanine9-N1)-methyltransferase